MERTSIVERRQHLARWRTVGHNGGARNVPFRVPPKGGRASWLALAVALCATSALADEISGARPGDEALTCEQIYAQGMAESQRDQQVRDQKTQAMRQQQQAFKAELGVAVATGGLVGGPAVEKSGQELLASQGRMGETLNQPNARKERLRQLWTEKHCAAPGSPSGKVADAAMTCEQIAAELAPYVQQMAPTVQANLTSQRQLNEQATALGERQRAESNALWGLSSAAALDPTGASKRAQQAAQIAMQQKHNAESQALLNSPQAQQAQAQREQLAAQTQQMQGDARLQQLLQLGQQKGCDRK